MGQAAVDRPVFGEAVSDQHNAAHATRIVARVKNYGDVLEEYEYHEEAKCADASGGRAMAKRRTAGPAPCPNRKLHFIGKESNKLGRSRGAERDRCR